MNVISQYSDAQLDSLFFKTENIEKLEEIIHKKDHPFFNAKDDEDSFFILTGDGIKTLGDNIFNFIDNQLDVSLHHPQVRMNTKRPLYYLPLFFSGFILGASFVDGNIPLAISSLGVNIMSNVGLSTSKRGYSKFRDTIFIDSRDEIMATTQLTNDYIEMIHNNKFLDDYNFILDGTILTMQEKIFKHGVNYNYLGNSFTSELSDLLKCSYALLCNKFDKEINKDLFEVNKAYTISINSSTIGYSFLSILQHDNPDILKEIYSDRL